MALEGYWLHRPTYRPNGQAAVNVSMPWRLIAPFPKTLDRILSRVNGRASSQLSARLINFALVEISRRG